MLDTQISERFHSAIDFLYEKNYHLATQVSRLSYPEVVDGFPPTAAVAWDENRKKVRFLFNSNFNQNINFEEFCFAVAHEATHVVNGHIFVLKSEIDRMKAKGKSNQEIQKFSNRFNIAADCVVNDSLVKLYNVTKVFFPDLNGKTSIFYGKETVGCDCHDLSVTDVMKLLPENIENTVENHDLWKSFFNDDGSIKKEFVDAVSDFLEECEGNSSLSDKESSTIDKLKETMSNCSDEHTKQAGRDAKSGLRKINALNASLSWDKILFRKVERGQFEDVWNRPERKLVTSYPKVILPRSKEKEVEEIFVAIDVSGSIDWKALDLFMSVIKNTPKTFKINAITFNTICEPFDIKSGEVRSGGGTNFGIIEEYIQKNLKKHPSAVFVLTDGCGSPVKPQYPKKWTWLLTSPCSTTYCQNMTHYEFNKVMR